MEQTQTPPHPNPAETPQQSQPQSQPQSQLLSSLPPPSPTIPPPANPSSNQNPNPKTTLTPVQAYQQQQQQHNNSNNTSNNAQPRPSFSRSSWPHQSPQFSHSSSSSSSSSSLGSSMSSAQRGGMATGVPPAGHHTGPVSSAFSSSFGQQQYGGGLGRGAGNLPVSNSSSSTSQVRPSTPGYQGMGTMGLGSGSQMRPGGISAHPQQRPGQPSLRPQSSPINQPPNTQNFQGHSLLRGSSMGTTGLPSPSSSQSTQSHNQPWLSSGSQGKPPLPSPHFRPPMNPSLLQQRSHLPQQQHSLPPTSQQQQMSAGQQPQSPLSSLQQQEQQRQQFQPSRISQPMGHQLQNARPQGMGNQKPPSLALSQPSMTQSGALNTAITAEIGESCNRIISKRSIHELVTQIDPSEKLDPEVEDILVDIADEFVDSITTFGCSLAKHRKSTTLEAKDILLHLERNWNMTLPGFGGDEIKCYRKPIVNEIHRERLAAIKKSMLGNETATTKISSGQAAGSVKSLAKAPANAMDSQS